MIYHCDRFQTDLDRFDARRIRRRRRTPARFFFQLHATMTHRTLISHAALLLFAQIVAVPAIAASLDDSVNGTVETQGKPVAHANVSLTNASGASVAQAVTDASGHFSVPHVAPGTYA